VSTSVLPQPVGSASFGAAGNVATESMTLPAGTDTQSFCYDEQDRLTWAGAIGTPPSTGRFFR
jgi:hypothetical protein